MLPKSITLPNKTNRTYQPVGNKNCLFDSIGKENDEDTYASDVYISATTNNRVMHVQVDSYHTADQIHQE